MSKGRTNRTNDKESRVEPRPELHGRIEYGNPLLEEYREVTAFMRHDDQIAWTIIGLCATLATGLWAYTFKDLGLCSWRSVFLALLGVVILTLGRLFARRITAITRARRRRGLVLEEKLGFKLLGGLDDDAPRKGILGVNRLLDLTVIAAVVAWMVYLVVRFTSGGCAG